MDDGSVNSRDIVARMKHPDARYVGPLDEAVGYLAGRLRPGAVLITLGAGDGYRVGELILETEARRVPTGWEKSEGNR
jgi:UDP-N-acetylmuramate--alanine ligase